MKQSKVSIVIIAWLFTACTSSKIAHYHFNQKTAAPQLRQDLVLLKQILEANHPSLYWYTTKDSLDAAFNQAINSITNSLTEVEFRNKVATVISSIKCGHTAARFSENYTKALQQHRYPCFPLSIKTWGDSMVVLGSLFPKDSIFKRGTIITAINGKTPQQLLDAMFPLISTDGNSNNFKSQVISSNFPNWYKLAFGVDSVYHINLINSKGVAKTVSIKNYFPVKETAKIRADSMVNKLPITPPPIVKAPNKRQQRRAQFLAKCSLTIDTANSIALLHVATFSGNLTPFFRHSVKRIAKAGVKNVIIDVRENTGGKLVNSTFLNKFFVDKPFKTGDTIAAATNNIHYKRYIPAAYFLWFPMHIFSKRFSDGRYHKHKEEQKVTNPSTKYHFNGNIYVLQSGLSFSAATLFVSNLKGQKNTIIIGEETGGGFYGNTAMFLPTIILPNSKLRVVLPLYRLVINSNRPKDGHGILPDILVPPNSIAIKKGMDLKMDTVLRIINKKPY